MSEPQNHTSSSAQRNSTIDLDAVLSQPAYLTNLSEFLNEQDDNKALRYCVENFIPKRRLTSATNVKGAAFQLISDIDKAINAQLNTIIHHPKFQKLEASWRGLLFLVKKTDGTKNIILKMLDISWAEVTKDISRALEFDQSHLFHKIYSEEYGSPGGQPYGAIIGDYEVSHRISPKHPHDDIATLEGMAQIAAASLSPFIAAASSELFGMENFSGLGQPLKLEAIFKQKEYIKWNSLREKVDARFVALTLPRTLMRQPYRKFAGSYKGIHFHEYTDANNHHHLWGNACYAFGGILIREFQHVGWFGHIRGTPRNYISGGLVSDIPIDTFNTAPGKIAFKPATDVIVTDALEKVISELGFMPLCQGYLSPFATFYNNQTIHQAQSYSTADARINGQLSAMLQHVLCGARVAHYIKVMMRDKVGSFSSAELCERALSDWLLKYTAGQEDLDWETQARYPLKQASVDVKEHPAKPGEYICVIRLQPHYQLDQMVSELELITELTALKN
ncbi:Uncharacterized protein ImpD [hydrothermal vent metagenome]|uniref:Uncharacterized protein ImpD n=1 Tax=hydrothermal vent metagenome TaxID=652676 RepID=A0A3B0ZNQ9_9ZZZZ